MTLRSRLTAAARSFAGYVRRLASDLKTIMVLKEFEAPRDNENQHAQCTIPDLEKLENHTKIFLDDVFPTCRPRIDENIGLPKGPDPHVTVNYIDDDGNAEVYNPKTGDVVYIEVDTPIHNKKAQYAVYESIKRTCWIH